MKTNRILLILAGLVLLGSPSKAQSDVKIGKQNIKLNSNLMTPEALWAMGRIGAAEASADGKQIVYQVGYYSCLLYTSPSPRDKRQSRMPSSA